MKWLVIIWTFYLAALSMLPCSDYNNRCEDSLVATQTTTHKTNTTAAHDHNRDSDDSCTPFCHCSCCSISIAVTDIKIIPQFEAITSFLLSQKLFWNNDSFISAYSGNIWQPPKINV